MGRAHNHHYKIIQNEFHKLITPTMIGEFNVYFCTCSVDDRTHTSPALTCHVNSTTNAMRAHIRLIPAPYRVKCGNGVQPGWIAIVCDRRAIVCVTLKHLNAANTVSVTKLHRHFRTQIEIESCVKLPFQKEKTFYFIFNFVGSSFDIVLLDLIGLGGEWFVFRWEDAYSGNTHANIELNSEEKATNSFSVVWLN